MLITSLQLVLKRTTAHLRLLSAVIIGVTLASAIMAASVVYFESLRDIALERALESVDEQDLDVLVEADTVPVNQETHNRIVDVIDGTAARRLAPYIDSRDFALNSWTFFVDQAPRMVPVGECPCRPGARPNQPGDNPDEQLLACDCSRASFMNIPRVEENVELVSGRLPEVSDQLPPEGEPYVVETMIDEDAARIFGLSLGGEMTLIKHWNDVHEKVTARVVGIYRRADPTAGIWLIYDNTFDSGATSLTFARFVVPQTTLISGLGGYFPSMGAEYAWRLDTNTDYISAADSSIIQGTLTLTDNELSAIVDGFSIQTSLGDVLEGFDTELFFNKLPMLIVMILIVLVVLYYVVTLASLLVDAQKGEIALLRSRGATSRQVLGVFLVEALLLALVGVIAGPFIAAAAVSTAGVIPFYSDLYDGNPLPVSISWSVWQMSLLGGGLSLLALFIPAFRATRTGILAERSSRARPQRLAFVQRYYLDLGFLGLVLFLFWQLTKQGSFVATDLFGEDSVNNLILAVPAVFLVAAGIVLLRVFPLLMDLTGRLLSSRFLSGLTPPALVLGIWQMARNPAHHARLSLLLILTAALGVFAASFSATLRQSEIDRALYGTGADVRVTNINTRAGGLSYQTSDVVAGAEGVLSASPVYREQGALISGFSSEEFDVLGIDGRTISDVAWFRDDFSSESLDSTLTELSFQGEAGMPIPEEGRWISVRLKPLTSMQDIYVLARFSDANGRFFTVPIGTLGPSSTDHLRFNCSLPEPGEAPDWCRVGSSLWPPQVGNVPPLIAHTPVRLHSIGVGTFQGEMLAGAVDIDDIAVLNATGERLLVLETFDELGRWRQLEPSADSMGDTFAVATDPAGNPIDGVARLRWTNAAPQELRGIAFGATEPALSVVVSPGFLDRYDVEIGDELLVSIAQHRTRIEIRGTIDLFPTLNPEERPFVISDERALHERLNADRFFGDITPNEVWASTETGREVMLSESPTEAAPTVDPAVESIKTALIPARLTNGPILDRSGVLSAIRIDPLISAGWRVLLGIAFATVLVVSAAGFLVHARVTFSARRQEFALLRTIGLSIRQLMSLVVLEQVLVIGVAIAIGVFMGTRLGDTIMPYLANSGEQVSIVPPMRLAIDWAGFAGTIGLLALVFIAVIVVILLAVYRMSIHHVMRMGEG